MRTLGAPYYRTEVGAHENSASPYGTFDQGGNMYEWVETGLSGTENRGIWGGSFNDPEAILQSTHILLGSLPDQRQLPVGFRVAKLSAPCPGDFNHSGDVSVQDIFDFLAAYFSNDPSADVNNSGAVTVQDIFDFLALYFTQCP